MVVSGWCAVLMLVAATFVYQTSAHIRITYPPARKYALDFLDNVRTYGPCGGMKAGNVLTDLEEGSTFNVLWHMAYAHKGGYMIELLEGDIVKYKLTPSTAAERFYGMTNVTSQLHAVTLPEGYTCSNCTLRVTRQAREWGSTYNFWSCADINIKSQFTYVRKCSGHGTLISTLCQCNRCYSGDDCQNRDECVDASDCSGHGACVDTRATFYPRRQCFCQPGWFGEDCSIVSTLSFDKTKYDYREMSEDFHVFSRIVQDEVEVILQANSSSYVALGWRPIGTTADCYRYPTGSLPKTRDLNPMDCTDIVTGCARGTLSRVADYYTRDRSTPRPDAFYGGGHNSLTAAIAQEEKGVTTVLFRRKLQATERQDYNIANGKMHVIWALGMNGHPELPEFYPQDGYKFHGVGNQRGWTEFSFRHGQMDPISAVTASTMCGLVQMTVVATGVTLALLLSVV